LIVELAPWSNECQGEVPRNPTTPILVDGILKILDPQVHVYQMVIEALAIFDKLQ
jgi:hypothetical protein